MALRTRLTELLGIEHPIIQGGMAWTATAELAAAVSNAGGLGIIGAGHMPTDVLRGEIRRAKELTDKPFGVNLMLLTPHIDELVAAGHRRGRPRRHDRCRQPRQVHGRPQGRRHQGAYRSSLRSHLPSAWSPSAPTRSSARAWRPAGHIGELTTMVLIPQLVDAVSIPVVAAGGIADGRGMAAAFALGAEGVQVGTRFMCAEECTIHPDVKAQVIKAKDRDTVVTGRSTGHPVRVHQEQALAPDRGARPREQARGDRGARRRQARRCHARRRHRRWAR